MLTPSNAISEESITQTAEECSVLLIVPDDKYTEHSSCSSFTEILQNDTDFQSDLLPNYDILEWKDEKTIKSGSFEMEDYIAIAKQISSKYLDYDGFVILDSISTMAYTASFLSFMFENLAKPIVLTGSHSTSMTRIFSDAKANLLQSLIVAGHTNICEVIVCFNKRLFRGNRTQRVDTHSNNPFLTFNYPKLGEFGATKLLLTNHCKVQTIKKRFKVFTKLCTHILVIHLTPHLTHSMLEMLLFHALLPRKRRNHTSPHNSLNSSDEITQIKTPKTPSPIIATHNFSDLQMLESVSCKSMPALNRVQSIKAKNKRKGHKSRVKGVILSLFGVGNAPSRQSFKDVLRKAMTEYECEIVVTCQSFKGGVDTTVYESGNFLSDLNLITARDMTTECCVAKLSHLLGNGYRGKALKEQFETDLRGEMTEMSEKKRRVVQHIPMDHNYNILSSDLDSDFFEKEIIED